MKCLTPPLTFACHKLINTFTLEPAVTAIRLFNPVPLPLVTSSVLIVLDNLDNKLVQGDGIFQAIPDPVKQAREKCKKPCNFDQKIPMKILSHYPLVLPSSAGFLQNLFQPKGSLVNAQQKKKMRKEKQKKRGGENYSCCACLNFDFNCNLAPGMKASLVLDL